MISRLLRSGISLLVYFFLATLIAQAVLLAYLGFSWKFDRNKIVQVLAILQDVDLFAIKEKAERDPDEISSEQVSYEQVTETRALRVQYLQLREQALKDGLDQLAFEQRKLGEEKKRYRQLKESFDKELATMQEGAVAAGTDNVRTKLEALKPKQAKELLVQMLEDQELNQVVVLLANMPTVKCAKIMSEFKTPSETEQLNEILRRIREGYPEADLAADMRKRLEQPERTGP